MCIEGAELGGGKLWMRPGEGDLEFRKGKCKLEELRRWEEEKKKILRLTEDFH